MSPLTCERDSTEPVVIGRAWSCSGVQGRSVASDMYPIRRGEVVFILVTAVACATSPDPSASASCSVTSDHVQLLVTANQQIPTVVMRVELLDVDGSVLTSFDAEAASVQGAQPRRVWLKVGVSDPTHDVVIRDHGILERVSSCRAVVTEMDLDGPTDP